MENQTINRIQCSSPWVKGSSVWKFFEAKDKFQNLTLLISYCTLQTCSMCIIIFSKSYLFAFDTGKFVRIKHSTGKLDGFQYFLLKWLDWQEFSNSFFSKVHHEDLVRKCCRFSFDICHIKKNYMQLFAIGKISFQLQNAVGESFTRTMKKGTKISLCYYNTILQYYNFSCIVNEHQREAKDMLFLFIIICFCIIGSLCGPLLDSVNHCSLQ